MSDQSLNDWLLWLELQHPVTIDLGLDRVASVAKRLGLESFSAKVVTVAGTNGKGSFVAALASMLHQHGLRTGCYTSPHLLVFNERVMINQDMVDDHTLVCAFEQIKAAAQATSTSLTYFEFTTLAALQIFAQADLDVIILEVGLGGRLDAVNIIAPDLAVITSIGLDHQDYLGDTLEAIAFEKAGILRETTPLISAEKDLLHYVPNVAQGRDFYQIIRDFFVDQKEGSWLFQAGDVVIDNLPDNGLSITSEAAAIVAAQQLLGEKIQLQSVQQALTEVQLAGRFQQFVTEEGVNIVLDVAHNPQAAGLLQSRLATRKKMAGKKRLAVFHALQDKDIDSIIGLLKDEFDAWFIGGLDHPRASDVDVLADKLHNAGCERVSSSKNLRQALSRALSLCQAGDEIIAFGSFFVVAELLPRVRRA